MKKRPAEFVSAIALIFAALFLPDMGAAEEKPVVETMSRVLGNPAQYHRRVIDIRGTISSQVKEKRFRNKDYTIFKIESAGGGEMLIYLRGLRNDLKTGQTVRVMGRFYRKRRFVFRRLKNVIKAREVDVLYTESEIQGFNQKRKQKGLPTCLSESDRLTVSEPHPEPPWRTI